jgi:hypothetical protein
MSEGAPGPGWWQASDLKWYPPQHQPDQAVAAAPPPPAAPSLPPPPGAHVSAAPAGLPPPLRPAPSSVVQPAGAQSSADSLAMVRGMMAKVSATAWLLIGGFIVATISIFLTWETVTQSVSVLGTPLYSETGGRGTSSGGKFILLAPIIAAAWLAWPVFAGITMSVKRLIGLSAVVGLMLLSIPVWFVVFRDSDAASGTTSSYGFGLFLFAAAVIAIAVGVIRLWIHRSKMT